PKLERVEPRARTDAINHWNERHRLDRRLLAPKREEAKGKLNMNEEKARKAYAPPPMLPRVIASLGILLSVILLIGAIALIGFAMMIPAALLFFAAIGIGASSGAAFYNLQHHRRGWGTDHVREAEGRQH